MLHIAESDVNAAEPLAERAVAIWEKALGPEHLNLAIALNNLAQTRRLRGQHAEAEPLYRRALSVWVRAGAENTPEYARTRQSRQFIHSHGR
jgi:hypothetical protein